MASKARLLVAEDDAEMRMLLKRALEHEGFEVEVASNGVDALEMLRTKGVFQVLISDIRMPVSDGEQLVPEAHRLCPGMKIILISGYAELELYLRLMQKGAFDYVTKPFKVPDLLDVIDRALESKA